jgi:chromosome segregation ATPase
MTMDQIPGGDAAGWAAMLATIAGGFLWLRRYLTGDAVDRAANKLAAFSYEALHKQLEGANLRNDHLLKALDGAHAKIAELNNHVFQLEVQVRRMRQQLDEIAPRSDTLQTGPTP